MESQYLLPILDAAHGRNVLGKCSPDERHKEYLWSREIIELIKERLNRKGMIYAETNVTQDEIGLDKRVRNAESFTWPNKLLISIHNNAQNSTSKWGTATGVEVFTWPGQSESDVIAEKFLELVIERFSNFKIRKDESDGDGDKEAPFTVLSGDYWAILIEWLFQDNKLDLILIEDRDVKNKLADLIVDLIIWTNDTVCKTK